MNVRKVFVMDIKSKVHLSLKMKVATGPQTKKGIKHESKNQALIEISRADSFQLIDLISRVIPNLV